MNTTLGTISHGTLRNQDLIPAFLDAVAEHAPDHYAQLIAGPFGPIPAHALEDDDADWWDSDDAGYLLEELQDLLAEHAPDYCYFGAHEGDGSDFGFWIDWERIADDARDEEILLVDDISARGGHLGPALVTNDHGNATLYAAKDSADAEDCILWSAV